MMFKSSSVTTFLLLATLAIVSTAQDAPTTPTLTSTASTSATTAVATRTGTVTGTPTITSAPTNNFTSVPDFSSLASVIASVATGRSLNPGYSPAPKAGGPAASAASRVGGAGGEVLMGLGLVVLSAVVAGAGTLAL